MKNFEIDLSEALSALASDDGFQEAIHSAFEEKYGEDYSQSLLDVWEERTTPPQIKLTWSITDEEKRNID